MPLIFKLPLNIDLPEQPDSRRVVQTKESTKWTEETEECRRMVPLSFAPGPSSMRVRRNFHRLVFFFGETPALSFVVRYLELGQHSIGLNRFFCKRSDVACTILDCCVFEVWQ